MLHLWSLATWNLEVTHDAGNPEWIDTPVTNLTVDSRVENEGNTFDGEKWAMRLPQELNLLTAWYMDEVCEHLYITCIDPRGITLLKLLNEIEVQEDLPRIHLAGYPLSHLWYTVDGFYTFTFAYFYGGLPYQHFGSFQILLMEKGSEHG